MSQELALCPGRIPTGLTTSCWEAAWISKGMSKGRGKGKEREKAFDPAGKVPSRISSTTSLVNSEFPEPQEVVCRLSCMHHMRLTRAKGCSARCKPRPFSRTVCGDGRRPHKPGEEGGP